MFGFFVMWIEEFFWEEVLFCGYMVVDLGVVLIIYFIEIIKENMVDLLFYVEVCKFFEDLLVDYKKFYDDVVFVQIFIIVIQCILQFFFKEWIFICDLLIIFEGVVEVLL